MTHTTIVEVIVAILGTLFSMAPVLYLIIYRLPGWTRPRRQRRDAGCALESTPSDSRIFLERAVPVTGAGDLEAGKERA